MSADAERNIVGAGGHGDPPLQKNIVGTIHELSDSIGRDALSTVPYIGLCVGYGIYDVPII